MKTETLEKIHNILEHLFELFIFILIMLITFGSLHVHAEESQVYKYTLSGHRVDNSNNTYCDTTIEYYINGRVALVGDLFSSGVWPEEYFGYNSSVLRVSSVGGDAKYGYRIYKYDYTTPKSSEILHTESNVNYPIVSSFGNWSWDYSTIVTDIPIFRTVEEACNYILTGDLTGNINNGGSDFDPHDDSYAFTGFSMSGKTATWTGTTERSYLLDMDVEEWVNYTYGFATSEDQEVSSFIDAEAHCPTSDKKLALPWDEMEANKKEGEFIRQVNIIPCYGTSGAGFYFGSPVCVYFDAKGNIEKVIHKSKPTDLNKGNMVYDSSIGYLQNVIYTEQKTHDGTGRQATFKWSTQKSLPSDAQVEIVAQNFYIEWFNKKTEENFVFKEYGEDCFYSAGSYSFNAQTPVWTWLKEKEIDPFSIKTQSYGSTEYYLRIVIYDETDLLYHYGGWVKVDIKSKDTTNLPSTDVETGGFDDSSGLWNQDTSSSDSYHYSTDDDGKLTGNIDVNSWEDLNMNSFTWMYRNMQSMVSSLGEFPTMVNAVFGYLPVQLITAIGVLLVAIVLLRFLGR